MVLMPLRVPSKGQDLESVFRHGEMLESARTWGKQEVSHGGSNAEEAEEAEERGALYVTNAGEGTSMRKSTCHGGPCGCRRACGCSQTADGCMHAQEEKSWMFSRSECQGNILESWQTC